MRHPFQLLLLLISLIYAYELAGAQQAIPLRLVFAQVSSTRLPLMIAHEEGIYKKNGLDVQQFVTVEAAEEAKQQYGITVNPQHVSRGGSNDPLGTAAIVVIISARATDPNARQDQISLASLESVLRHHVVARPEITSIEQLKGRRLGVSSLNGSNGFATMVMLERMGWDRSRDVSLILGSGNLAALKDRRVDAFVADEFDYVMATAAGFHSVLDMRNWKVPMPGGGVTVSRAWLKDNRDTARRFIKSMVEAIALMKKDKNAAFRTMENWWGITDAQRRDMLYAPASDVPSKPYPPVEGIKKALQLHSNELQNYKADDFHDASLVKELDDSGFIDSLYK